MQTFLPYPDFDKSAACLDIRRLGKQRVEAKQIYLALTDSSYGWQNHPAVRMWRGHQAWLLRYGVSICAEWVGRGYNDNCMEFFWNNLRNYSYEQQGTAPAWWGDTAFHLSHQSNLVRKDPFHYRHFFPAVPDDLPYIWPASASVPEIH